MRYYLTAGRFLCAFLLFGPWGDQYACGQSSQQSLQQALELAKRRDALLKEERIAEATTFADQIETILRNGNASDNINAGAHHQLNGLVYQKAERFSDAQRSYRLALSIYADRPAAAAVKVNTMLSLAGCYAVQEDYAKAEAVLNDIENINTAPGTADLTRTMVLLIRAQMYQKQGNATAAKDLIKELLRKNQSNHQLLITLLEKAAVIERDAGDHAAAANLYEQLIRLARSSKPDMLATAQFGLGQARNNQSRFKEAQEQFQEALATLTREGKQNSELASRIYSAMSAVNFFFGDVQQAIVNMNQSVQILQEAAGRDSLAVALLKADQGAQYNTIGNAAKSEEILRDALKQAEFCLGPKHSLIAPILNTLATALSRQQQHVEAISLAQRALDIYQQRYGKTSPQAFEGMIPLARARFASGDVSGAAELIERIPPPADSNWGQESIVLDLKSRMQCAQNHFDQAEATMVKALTRLEQELGAVNPLAVGARYRLASIFEAQGKTDPAISQMDRTLQDSLRYVRQTMFAMTPEEQLPFLNERVHPALMSGLTLARRHPDFLGLARHVSEWLINCKGLSQESLAARNRLLLSVSGKDGESLVRELSELRRDISQISMTGTNLGDNDQRQNRLAELMAREQEIVRSLAGQLDGESFAAPWFEQPQLSQAVDEQSVFVDFARYKVNPFDGKPDQANSEVRYLAMLTKPKTDEPVYIDLGEASDIDNLIQQVRAQVLDDAASEGAIDKVGEETATIAYMERMERLSNAVWKPIRKHIDGQSQLILCPDGPLWLLPWSALPADADGLEFLIEQRPLRFVTSARELLVANPPGNPQAPAILAAPQFDQDGTSKANAIRAIFRSITAGDESNLRSVSIKRRLSEVDPLPNTEIEALAVKPSLDEYCGAKATLYKGEYALERVAKALRSPRVVTFATHGFFLPPEDGLDDAFSDDIDSASSRRRTTDPLLRCGLLLAGCNSETTVGDDDGVLTGMEIVGLDLRGTDLVVLSACETGMGDVNSGEGVAGLRQAFRLAGANAIVASLWSVDDSETARLMIQFFENLAAGMEKPEALRQAQIDRIRARRERFGAAHPFFWAPFTMTGGL
ncbi:MAG: CHAT domain-containing protein [Planctomycetaceae bacterium]|nr:CHAT domain-containing protein [Planctomycetaceae bacterium]